MKGKTLNGKDFVEILHEGSQVSDTILFVSIFSAWPTLIPSRFIASVVWGIDNWIIFCIIQVSVQLLTV